MNIGRDKREIHLIHVSINYLLQFIIGNNSFIFLLFVFKNKFYFLYFIHRKNGWKDI